MRKTLNIFMLISVFFFIVIFALHISLEEIFPTKQNDVRDS